MSANDIQTSPSWKKPDEVMQLLRMKQKKRSLQKFKERMRHPSQSCPDLSNVFGKTASPNFSRILGSEKRKNPFSKNTLEKDEKQFCNNASLQDESTDSTLFQLLGIAGEDKGKSNIEKETASEQPLTSFTNILSNLGNKNTVVEQEPENDEAKHYIPIDWALKTRMRLMSPNAFAWNQKLKASEEASGITGFVRCLDTSNSSTLDTSHHARFHQHCLYWQHPSLPSMCLFPRTNGRISNRNFISNNDEVKTALHKEWTESFRSLFQLLRARQCPYFYVCANTFTCLFRAAGIGGIVETCAFVSPTTRGFRQMLQQEEIEFTMPLKRQEKKKGDKSKEGDGTKNSSTDSCYDTMDNTNSTDDNNLKTNQIGNVDENNEDEDDDDMESDEWLQSLGVTDDIIKNINHSQMRINRATESQIDSSAESLVCVRGVDAQALFNFLLNCKSSIALTGTYGGIPPTLLSPTAFQGSTLKSLKVRQSTVHSENGKYFSVELRGPILPTTVQSLCSLIQSNSKPFSGTFANYPHTNTYSKVAKMMTEDEKAKENASGKVNVFGRENLSDCGLNTDLLQHFCSLEPSIVETIDAIKYCSDKNVYMWT